MRKLIASTFTSLDGVMQAPGGPTEDPTGNFTLGGWQFAFRDAGMDISAAGFDGKDRELVLGRKTHEIFEAYWPYQSKDNAIAKTLNAARKHVASRALKSLQWNNSSLFGGDIISAISALKRRRAISGPVRSRVSSPARRSWLGARRWRTGYGDVRTVRADNSFKPRHGVGPIQALYRLPGVT